MEGHIDTWQRDGREAALQLDVTLGLLLLLSLLVAGVDDLGQHGLDLVNRELLGKLKNIVSASLPTAAVETLPDL